MLSCHRRHNTPESDLESAAGTVYNAKRSEHGQLIETGGGDGPTKPGNRPAKHTGAVPNPAGADSSWEMSLIRTHGTLGVAVALDAASLSERSLFRASQHQYSSSKTEQHT